MSHTLADDGEETELKVWDSSVVGSLPKNSLSKGFLLLLMILNTKHDCNQATSFYLLSG